MISFTGLLTIVFITLKLCGVIAWSWIWVLSPLWFWGAVAFCATVFASGLIALVRVARKGLSSLGRFLDSFKGR